MRTAGKTDLEITAELTTAGWAEADINQELSSKTSKIRFNLGKMKFWIVLYGIPTLYLYITYHYSWGWVSALRDNAYIFSIILTFVFPVLPIFTLLAILSGLLTRKPSSISYGWLLVIASTISGAIMTPFGLFSSHSPQGGGLEEAIVEGISLLGFIWLAFSLVFTVMLIMIKKFRKTKLDSKQSKSKALP